MPTDTDRAYFDNLRLSQAEYEQRHTYLYSRPRCLGLVLEHACNLNCIHCYQGRTGQSLLRPVEIGAALRRELMAFYPTLSTLRVQGGEVFAIRGFRELIDDVAAMVRRPMLSISTNGTLIDEEWAERLVRGPFSNVTISIDGATRATFNRLRQGADLNAVLANIDRIQRWKSRLGCDTPYLDSFFVIMRSNFREIPSYLELMERHGMIDVTLQTLEITPENVARTPGLEADEVIAERGEVEELHTILRSVTPRFRGVFRTLRVSGLQTLFQAQGLDASFLEEGERSLYPDSDGLAKGAFELCPNPWTTLFVAANGDTHLCFLSTPIGNLYAEPLAALWNSAAAIAKRGDMIAGRYAASGCAPQYCGWREGQASPVEDGGAGRQTWLELAGAATAEAEESPGSLALVRRVVTDERRRVAELEGVRRNQEALLEAGQRHIDHLEARVRTLEARVAATALELAAQAREHDALLAAGQAQIDHLEGKAAKAVADFSAAQAELERLSASWVERAARVLPRRR